MWKDSEWVKKRQKTAKQAGGQLGGKVAEAIGEKAIKDKEGEIQDEEALDALFNEIV